MNGTPAELILADRHGLEGAPGLTAGIDSMPADPTLIPAGLPWPPHLPVEPTRFMFMWSESSSSSTIGPLGASADFQREESGLWGEREAEWCLMHARALCGLGGRGACSCLEEDGWILLEDSHHVNDRRVKACHAHGVRP